MQLPFGLQVCHPRSTCNHNMYTKPEKFIAYGTAGFREHAKFLPSVLYRVGLLAALRSRFLGGKYVGVMITASHNPPQDNGAKLVEPMGEMLDQSWEKYASGIANADDADVDQIVDNLYSQLEVDKSAPANVIYGRDTRESGPELVKALKAGLDTAKATSKDVGIVTTPQLHYLVRAQNTVDHENPFGRPDQDGYYEKLAEAYAKVLGNDGEKYQIVVDCANGVGALKLEDLAPHLTKYLDIEIVNSDCENPSSLNVDCGADYVKSNQRLPAGISPHPNKLYASFDGDADRVVFYYTDAGKFHLLDGDKIATLAASFLKELVPSSVNLGVVQTAYANGSSTKYLKETLKVPVVCTPTGVKHLHHAAVEFDAGVYFEANGHGTVVFKPKVIDSLRHSDDKKSKTLVALNDLINQAVGDAISDLLMVIAILSLRKWTPEQWDECYTDLPNRLMKAAVKDRTMFTTTDAERKLVSPKEVQPQLDELMKHYPSGRTFVRASGTEDVVRIYSESTTQELADELANKVKDLLQKYA